MKIKGKNKIRIIIYLLLIAIIFSIIFLIFKREISKEKQTENNVGFVDGNTILPTPDRIIYKYTDDKYIIINDDTTNEYTQIYSELYGRITNVIEGKMYSEDEISRMQKNGRFIEFDYNRKSKNFVFFLDEDEIGIIKRTSNAGQVIQTSLPNKDELIKKIDNLAKKTYTIYYFDTEYNFNSENKLPEVTADLNLSKTKIEGVYQKVIEYNENEYNSLLKKLNFKTNQDMPTIDFDRESVVITVSKYEIKNIKKNIGNIKYELGNLLDEYMVNVFIVSKIVNTSCIYFDTTTSNGGVFKVQTNSDEAKYLIEYNIDENENYSITRNGKKKYLIKPEKAADIADEEAKKEKYQYQDWKSEFYSRNSYGEFEYNLLANVTNSNQIFYWDKVWQIEDLTNKIMWRIRLDDANDPLTSIYIFVDAQNGKVLGAGKSSD